MYRRRFVNIVQHVILACVSQQSWRVRKQDYEEKNCTAVSSWTCTAVGSWISCNTSFSRVYLSWVGEFVSKIIKAAAVWDHHINFVLFMYHIQLFTPILFQLHSHSFSHIVLFETTLCFIYCSCHIVLFLIVLFYQKTIKRRCWARFDL